MKNQKLWTTVLCMSFRLILGASRHSEGDGLFVILGHSKPQYRENQTFILYPQLWTTVPRWSSRKSMEHHVTISKCMSKDSAWPGRTALPEKEQKWLTETDSQLKCSVGFHFTDHLQSWIVELWKKPYFVGSRNMRLWLETIDLRIVLHRITVSICGCFQTTRAVHQN